MTLPSSSPAPVPAMRDFYQQQTLAQRAEFEKSGDGRAAVEARSGLADTVVVELWHAACASDPRLRNGIALVAIGGYGRQELFPHSDLDILFLLDGSVPEGQLKNSIRRICQEMWDCGIRTSPQTRTLAEAERFSAGNAEFTLSLLDHRFVAGDEAVHARLAEATLPKLLQRDGGALLRRLAEMTQARHAKYGDTLFHLEPNIKDCPGGLRDAHVCRWLEVLAAGAKPRRKATGQPPLERVATPASSGKEEFSQALNFLFAVRCFLHYRAGRDDNTLDWRAQDEAAARSIGNSGRARKNASAAFWMRLYFRHARSIDRRVSQMLDEVSGSKARPQEKPRQKGAKITDPMFRVEHSRIFLNPVEVAATGSRRAAPENDPEAVMRVFEAIARTGCRLGGDAEDRLELALPVLSAHLEEGPALWNHLRAILTGDYAGRSLRAMHALGILELMVPEFHGIDALVIRDAYHRYTVDEHTFVVLDTLHSLPSATSEWEQRLAGLLKELHHPDLLYLAALLHDTGKGRSKGEHAQQSVALAREVLARMELDAYDSGLVLHLIANHLEMSAALRRDIFDAETVRAFAAKAGTPDQLRMLTLFTYADINAVHPGALTPWKAENLWRLYMATSNYLDRTVDEERVHASTQQGRDAELVDRVTALVPEKSADVLKFLEGFPQRYLRTATPERLAQHYRMSTRFDEDSVQLDFHHTDHISEITLVTPDRKMLFANMAGSLAALGMDIVTADAYSNAQGVVVDSFRFTDRFRTLELNPSERGRFVKSIHDVMTGATQLEKLLEARSRSGRKRTPKISVESNVEFDNDSSSHSTVVQVVAQDVPGLLRALAITLANHGCNIEVALVDTEGETAIDVFYITRLGRKLDDHERSLLGESLLAAISESRA